jgi:PPOX class probable F420-dependent enzyme
MVEQGDVALLEDPVAQAMLVSPTPARLAYVWPDGTPRVVPVWFHWSGEEVVVGSPPRAPKLKALDASPRVAVTIDADEWPYRVLSLRGTAVVEHLDDVVPEYEAAAVRYFGPQAAEGWLSQVRGRPMSRIRVRPDWVAVLDFQTRWPSALSG